MRDRILSLAALIREGNSLRADIATTIKHELHEVARFLADTEDMEVKHLLHSIIKNQSTIMDQNKAVNDALDRLSSVVNEGVTELKAIASTIQPGMTDDQVNASVARINALADQLSAVETPAAQA